MRNETKITKSEFIEMLKNWKNGAQPVSIQYITEPKLTKEGKKLFGDVIKIANIGAMVGYIYENSVNNQLEREGKERDFMTKPLWNGKGVRISHALSLHTEKGNYYLTYKYQQTFKSKYLDKNLNEVPSDMLKPYFPESNPAQSQGTETAIYHRELNIDNVRRLKFKRMTYVIV